MLPGTGQGPAHQAVGHCVEGLESGSAVARVCAMPGSLQGPQEVVYNEALYRLDACYDPIVSYEVYASPLHGCRPSTGALGGGTSCGRCMT